ncbi:MAG: DUF4446 family protein [Clostridiales bacterium]|jgi:hypothetical protein|nr:DUF4446 family protein [Clostridiales bacterium]
MDLYINAALVVIIILFVMLLLLYRKVNILSARYLGFMRGRDGASLEDRVTEICVHMDSVEAEVAENRLRLKEIAAVLNTATRGIGVVRFNAFQDTGSDLSFSVAFLDAHKNGLVLSSIYGREESRTYAKPVKDGQSQYQLSIEEREAIQRAADSLLQLK